MPRKTPNTKRIAKSPITIKRILRSKAFTVFVALSVIVIGISLTKQIIRKVEIGKQISSLETEISDLEKQNSELNTLLEYFNSSSFQEKEARKKLGLKDEGETVIMLPNNGSVTATGIIEVVEAIPEEDISNVTKWKKYFFN